MKTSYEPKYTELLRKINLDRVTLDARLQKLITRFEEALDASKNEDVNRHKGLLKILVQVDALISYRVSKLYDVEFDERSPPQRIKQVDKTKIFALKAKALKLKMRLNRGVKV